MSGCLLHLCRSLIKSVRLHTDHLSRQSLAISVWAAMDFLLSSTSSHVYKGYFSVRYRQRPYHVESTGSRPIPEVKQRRARLVLGWVTAWEHRVSLATFFFFYKLK